MAQLGRATFRHVLRAPSPLPCAPVVRRTFTIPLQATLRPARSGLQNSPSVLLRAKSGRSSISFSRSLSRTAVRRNQDFVSADRQRIYTSTYRCRPLPPPTSIFHYHFPPSLANTTVESIKDDSYATPDFPANLPAYIDGITGRQLSREQVRQTSLRLGYALTHTPDENANPPAQTGDVVFILSPNSLHYPVIFFACQSSLLIPTLCNSTATSRDVAYQLKDSGAKIGFVHPDLVGVWKGAMKILQKESHAKGKSTEDVPMFVMAPADEWSLSASQAETTKPYPSYESLMLPDSLRNGTDETALQAWTTSMDSWGSLQVSEATSGHADGRTNVSYDDTAVICYSSGTTGLPKGMWRDLVRRFA